MLAVTSIIVATRSSHDPSATWPAGADTPVRMTAIQESRTEAGKSHAKSKPARWKAALRISEAGTASTGAARAYGMLGAKKVTDVFGG